MAESRINTECSLTAREGISGAKTHAQKRTQVPSLHVRVYRLLSLVSGTDMSSLTAREGISARAADLFQAGGFPHCT